MENEKIESVAKSEESDPHPGAALGDDLRAAREARGLNLAEVAESLCIRESFLAALESGSEEDLPGPAYAIGFVRTYASSLGLDGDDAVRRYKVEAAGGRKAELVFPEPVSESRMPKGAILFLSLLLAAAAYGGWYYMSRENISIANLVPNVPGHLTGVEPAPMAPTAAAKPATPATLPTAEAPASPPPKKAKSPPAKAETSPAQDPTPSTPPVTASKAKKSAAPARDKAPKPQPAAADKPRDKSKPTAPIETVRLTPPTPASAPASRDAPATASPRRGGRVVIKARRDVWIQVRGTDGSAVVSRILRTGESYAVPTGKKLTLMTGNAGALEILVDGSAVPPIGTFGTVRRDVALDAEKLLAGTAVGQ